MSKKIVGVTVGTPIKPSVIEQKIKPVKSINGILPDDDGNVGVDITTSVRLAELSDGHLGSINPAQNRTITTYKETNGKIEAHSTATGSSYIKCPKYLLMHFPDDAARAYVYFYDRVGDEYIPNWDVISQTTSSSVKNYLSRSNAAPYLFEIPDGVYMQIGKAAGEVEFFGWDGEPFGMPLSADYNYPKYSGEADVFNTDGSYGVTIPGDAEYAIAHDGCGIWVVNGYIGDTATLVFSSVAKSFVKLPEGYDFFRARIVPNEKGKAATGDMTGLISAAVCSEATMATDKALRIMENCRKVSSLKWTPLADVPVKNGEGYTFKAGVEYMGIPYGSNWKIPHYIGWHVTPHTFVNAVNDADSIFYHETVSDGEVTAPYYSLVCSSFATMCAGWPYPQPNYAYLYDPMVDVAHSATPVIGELYAHLDPAGSHVVIPERIDRLRNDVAVSAYECVRPVCQRTTRYGKVIKSNNIDVYHVSNGSDYYDEYGYVVHHWLADPDMSVNVPYIDTDDVEIIGGSARPYKGDKSVYTSAEDSVLINIKDTSAANLLITKKGSSEGLGISINGASQVDVKPYLTGDGIYYVSTNVDPTEESFEYHEVEAIEYSMVNGVPVLKSKDFWYIMFRMSGDYRHKSGIATAQLPADDYSYLIENGATCHYVYSIFRKGEYGAYAVPFELTEVREDTDNPTTGGAVSDERIAAAVEAYMAENPVECDGVKTVNGNAPDENGNVQIDDGDSQLVVTFTENGEDEDGNFLYTASHTPAEIYEAVQNGQNVVGQSQMDSDVQILQLMYCTGNEAVFNTNDDTFVITLLVHEDKSAHLFASELLPAEVFWELEDFVDNELLPNIIQTPQTASVGQTIAVKAVDENGKPTEWEAVDMPDALPNPHPLTINGKPYDGSEPVDMVIIGGSASGSASMGQTPITLPQAASIRLVGDGEYTYTVKGVTVADLSTVTIAKSNATLTEHEDYIELTITGSPANWYNAYASLTVNGLAVGEDYNLCVESLGIDNVNKSYLGYFLVKNASGTELTRLEDSPAGLVSKTFTATSETITVTWYPSNGYYWTNGYKTALVGDIYINKASDGTERTGVINESGTFTDSYSLGQLPKGATITSEPSCEVYSVTGGGGSSESSAPMQGKTVVCFGDSLFGMYTGDTSAPAYAAQKTGATVYNVGFGGCRMSEHPYTGYDEFSMYALANAIASSDWSAQDAAASKGSTNFPDQLAILKSIDFGDVDVIVIHYGTNDFAAGDGVAIDNESNPKATNTLCGALRYSVETLLTAYPKLRIFVSLPAFRYWTDGNGVITYSDEKQNTNGDTLPDFVKALAETAKEYNLPVIDCYYGLGINKSNASTFLSDGTHHNVDGRKRFGEYIGAKLISDGDTFHSTDSETGGSSIDVTAEVGQTIAVEEVDANGKPTKWTAVDFPSGGDEEWVEILNTVTEAETAYVDLHAPEGKKFKKMQIHISTKGNGLSTAAKILLKGSEKYNASLDSNGNNLARTNGTIGTWRYIAFTLETGALFPVVTVADNSFSNMQIGNFNDTLGINTDARFNNNGPWGHIRVQVDGTATFNAGVCIYAWGVYV